MKTFLPLHSHPNQYQTQKEFWFKTFLMPSKHVLSRKKVRDRLKMFILILSDFKRINQLLFAYGFLMISGEIINSLKFASYYQRNLETIPKVKKYFFSNYFPVETF